LPYLLRVLHLLARKLHRMGFLCRGCGGSGEEVPPRVQRTMEALLRLPLAALGRLHIPEDDLRTMDAMLTAFRAAQVAL
ncbi:MAG: hypothetical protein ACPLRP_01900, partial [Candidatus Bipolaricaulaceae bacterium]